MTEDELKQIYALREEISQRREIVLWIKNIIGKKDNMLSSGRSGLTRLFFKDEFDYINEVINKALEINKAKLKELEEEFEKL